MSKFLDKQGLGILWELIGKNFQHLKIGLASDYEATYIPNKGQICLVNTENAGIQIKIGDGENAWANLDYYNQGTDIIIRGYKGVNDFFYDNILTKPIEKMPHKIYIDLNTDKIYVYEHSQYTILNSVPAASASEAGIMKLYTETGTNTDGTMTQKAITDALKTKVGASVIDGVAIFA